MTTPGPQVCSKHTLCSPARRASGGGLEEIALQAAGHRCSCGARRGGAPRCAVSRTKLVTSTRVRGSYTVILWSVPARAEGPRLAWSRPPCARPPCRSARGRYKRRIMHVACTLRGRGARLPPIGARWRAHSTAHELRRRAPRCPPACRHWTTSSPRHRSRRSPHGAAPCPPRSAARSPVHASGGGLRSCCWRPGARTRHRPEVGRQGPRGARAAHGADRRRMAKLAACGVVAYSIGLAAANNLRPQKCGGDAQQGGSTRLPERRRPGRRALGQSRAGTVYRPCLVIPGGP